jgi:outer membrane protein assembly factor BamB
MFPSQTWLLRPIVIGCFAAAVCQTARSSTVVCPAESFPDVDAWRAWVADARAGRADVGWLQAALDNHGADLIATPDGGLVSVRQAVATLPAPARAAVAGAYEARFGVDARRLLEDVLARPDHAPADLCAVADRYPLSTVAPLAREAAAARALDQGDVDAAAALATPGGEVARRLAMLPRGAPPCGAVAFAADWYAKLNHFGEPRVVPVEAADTLFVTDDRGVVATRRDGTPLWRWTPPAATLAGPVFGGGTGRGPLCVPAVLCDDAGRPQLVVVRVAAGLVALRAADGRMFWTTAGDPAWSDVQVLGPPTVAGRLVLAVALATPDAATGMLQLIAADVTDGRPIWQCALGPVADPARLPDLRRWHLRDPEPFRDAAPPTVAGDLVFVADNAGAIVAVNRFGGDARWVRPYAPAPPDGGGDRRPRGGTVVPPLPRAALLRWSAATVVCGDVVWAAPQDAVAAWGLDRRTGRVLWQTSTLPDDATCVGVVDGRFVLGGQSVSFVDPTTGVADATWVPPPGVALTGPPVVRGGRLSAESTAGILHPAPAGAAPLAAPSGPPKSSP